MQITVVVAIIYIIFYLFLSRGARKWFLVLGLMIGGYELILLFHRVLVH